MSSKWQETLERVAAIQRAMAANGIQPWYRGQRNVNWPIRSRLHRRVLEYFSKTGVHFGEAEDRAFLREEYKTLYRKFKAQAWHLLDPIERNDWGIIFRMQHYGFATRLLDWTKSFACAVYFAQLERTRDEEAAVYLLNPEGLNRVSAGRVGLIALDENSAEGNWDTRPYHPRWLVRDANPPTIAVQPLFSNPRMVAQRSAFTLSGDSFDPLENQFDGELVKQGFLERIVLTTNSYDEVENFLQIVGLGHFEYFPDLEGLRASYQTEMQKNIETALTILRPPDNNES